MAVVAAKPKTVEDVKRLLRERLARRVNPMNHCDAAQASAAIDRLQSLEADHWAQVWGDVGARFEEVASEAEGRGDEQGASEAHFQAYTFYYVGRFPCPNHPSKERCARKAREQYLAAASRFDPPLRRVAIPFRGRPDEGTEVVGYLRRPANCERPPVVVQWGGIDGFKEERHSDARAFAQAGFASFAVDMPGTGEAPTYVSVDGERSLAAALDWLRGQEDLDGQRLAVMGVSFGGYWATKVAHLYRDRLRAAVSWGGSAHFNFQADWARQSRYANSYLFDLAETRARACGLSTYEDYVAFVPKLSLLDQGVLDRACAPLLLVNGRDDRQVPVEDYYLLLEHGDPKTVRLFPGGHMGRTPETLPTIVNWLARQLHD